MRLIIFTLGFAVVFILLFAWLSPTNDSNMFTPRTDMPWQITPQPDGSSIVFDINLGNATSEALAQKFGPIENMAVYELKAGGYRLEAYYEKAQLGPLAGKLVASFSITSNEAKTIIEQAGKREGSGSGDWKWKLTGNLIAQQADRKLTGITYIPKYKGLEAAFFKQRLGEPKAWHTFNSEVVQWFYPELGLSLLLQADGNEIMEYVPPRDFKLPPDAILETQTAAQETPDN